MKNEKNIIEVTREQKQQITSDILMNRLNDIDYSEERRLKKGIFSDEFAEIWKEDNLKLIQRFKCNHCGYEQLEENYNPLDLYSCKKCGKWTAECQKKKKGCGKENNPRNKDGICTACKCSNGFHKKGCPADCKIYGGCWNCQKKEVSENEM
jgi:hypothetical protein